jgi:hypothetical protein
MSGSEFAVETFLRNAKGRAASPEKFDFVIVTLESRRSGTRKSGKRESGKNDVCPMESICFSGTAACLSEINFCLNT